MKRLSILLCVLLASAAWAGDYRVHRIPVSQVCGDCDGTLVCDSAEYALTGTDTKTFAFTGKGELWIHFQIKWTDTTPSSDALFLVMNNSSHSAQVSCWMLNTTPYAFYMQDGTQTSGPIDFTINPADATYYHLWIHWKRTATRVSTLGIASSVTEPTTGPNFFDMSTWADSADDVTEIVFSSQTTTGITIKQIIVDDAVIGDVCP